MPTKEGPTFFFKFYFVSKVITAHIIFHAVRVKKCQNSTEKCSVMDISAKLLCGSTPTFEDKLFASLPNALDVVQ
jgi:hypothetical protein